MRQFYYLEIDYDESNTEKGWSSILPPLGLCKKELLNCIFVVCELNCYV